MSNFITSLSDVSSINTLVTYYDSKRDSFVGELEKDTIEALDGFISGKSYLSIDKTCMNNAVGEMTKYSNDFTCSSCENLWKITKMKKEILSKKFTLFSSSHRDRCLGVRKFDIPTMEYSTKDKFFKLDPFSNTVITTLYTNKVQDEKGFTLIPKVYDTYICVDNAYMVSEVSNLSNYDNVFADAVNVKSCILQFLVFCEGMKPYRYSHGDPTIGKLQIVKQNVKSSKQFRDYYVDSSVSLKMFPSENCSLTLPNGNRIYSNKHKHSYATLSNATLVLDSEELPKDEHDTRDFFILSDYIDYSMFQSAKGYGFYRYPSSIDTYIFLVSLCSSPKINSHGIVKEIWEYIWDEPLDFPKSVVKDERGAYSMIVGKKLKKDVVRGIMRNFYN